MIRTLLAHLLFVATIALAPSSARAEFLDFDAKSLAKIRAVNAGRPFILAFWSIHCAPCRDEMSQWGPLQRRHPEIPVVLVATDRRTERVRLEKALIGQDLASVELWAFNDEFEERVRYSIDPKWRGELPRTYLFDAGHRTEGRSGPADLRWIEPWIERQARKGQKAR